MRHDGTMSDLQAIRSPGFDADAGTVAVLLHGYGSNEHDLAGLAVYLPPGLPWVAVRAPLRHPAFGYAWYPLETDDFAPAELVAEATDALWSWIDENLPAAGALVPLGFSQGGLMATQLLRTRPARIAAAVVLSGFTFAGPLSGDADLADARTPVFWGRGDSDQVVPTSAVDAAAAWLPAHTALTARVYPALGHSVSERELDDMRAFLAEVTGAGSE